jgi:hypothetical protein
MKKLFLLLFILPFSSFAQFTYNQGFSIGSTGYDVFNAVEITSAGNKICAGSFIGSIDVDPGAGISMLNSNGAEDGMVIAYDPAGAVLWAKNFGDTGLDAVSNLELDNTGNIFIAGYFEGSIDLGGGPLTSIGPYDIFLVKLDAFGQHIWSKRLGGIDESTSLNMAIDAFGNDIALAGYFSDSMDLGTGMLHSSGSTNVWVARLDAVGNTEWSHAFGGSGFATDRANAVAVDLSGNIYVTGNIGGNVDVDPGPGTHILSSVGSGDFFLVKFDQAGIFVDAFSVGGLTGDVPFEVAVSDVGDIFITGYSNSDSIDADPDPTATAYLTGDTSISHAQDLILVKYNSAFDYQWGIRFGKVGNDIGHFIRVDSQGNVLHAGIFSDATIDFDPGPGIFNMNVDSTMSGINLPYLVRYDNNGNFIDGFAFEDSVTLNAMFIENGRVWIAGVFRGVTLDPDPGIGVSLMTNAGDRDAFLAAYNYLSVGTEELVRPELNVYPNPCRGKVRIVNHDVNDKIVIFDNGGKIVRSEVVTENGWIDMRGLVAGNYFISVGDRVVAVTVME